MWQKAVARWHRSLAQGALELAGMIQWPECLAKGARKPRQGQEGLDALPDICGLGPEVWRPGLWVWRPSLGAWRPGGGTRRLAQGAPGHAWGQGGLVGRRARLDLWTCGQTVKIPLCILQDIV